MHIILEDGIQLNGDLYQRGISRVPGILMIAPDKDSWGFLPVRLYTAGMTVLVAARLCRRGRHSIILRHEWS